MLNSNNNKKEEVLIFIHIPKAGGTTLQRLIEKQYKPENVFTIHGKYFHESIENFKGMTELQHQKIRLLKGHIFFGLHKFLPLPSTYITILRNPVERIVSHYYYILQNPTHYLYQDVISHQMSLKDYVCSGVSPELDNCQTRLLSGVEEPVAFGDCSPEMLLKAKDNLRTHFAVVGILEKFDETMLLLKSHFSWKAVFYVKQNKTQNKKNIKSISKETLDAIEKHNQLDIELYQYGEKNV